ncbi:hypothetical protein RIF29_42247 [Crotalaria pallida]|uniref:RNA polymerase subunit H/Rpb5 C-terminal domain-containing protein n=1 Tax=Crotalaria pallida TaxID=3830 RepID=A0AAN9HSD7_CROPI
MEQPPAPNAASVLNATTSKPPSTSKQAQKRKLTTPKELISHYESQGMETQEASIKVIDDLQKALFGVISSGRGKKDKVVLETSRKVDAVNSRLTVLAMKLDSKPGYAETFAIGLASGAAIQGIGALVPHILGPLAQIWKSVTSVNKFCSPLQSVLLRRAFSTIVRAFLCFGWVESNFSDHSPKSLVLHRISFFSAVRYPPPFFNLLVDTAGVDKLTDFWLAKHIYVFFPDEPKVGVKTAKTYLNRMKTENVFKAILVCQLNLTPFAKSSVTEISLRFQIEIFQEAELLVNIVEHILVPEHQILTDAEKKTLLKRCTVKETQITISLLLFAVIMMLCCDNDERA